MALMMQFLVGRAAACAELGGSAVWAEGPTAIAKADGWAKGGGPAG